MTVAIVIVAAIAVVVLIGIVIGRRRSDPVETFQRQIDALGPEARRPTIDQVRRVDDDPDTNDET